MVATPKNVTVRFLSNTIKVILNQRITWELRNNSRGIVQCHRCQRWGHATTNCSAQPRCLKCALPHWTHTCKKTRETEAKCANCEGGHPANSEDCQIYQSRIKIIEDRRTPKTPNPGKRFVEAPKPKENIWNRRQEERRLEDTGRIQNPANSHPHTAPNVSGAPGEGLGGLLQLKNAFNQLQQNINISEALRMINDLNNSVSMAKSQEEKFSALMGFMEQINNYQL
ncbi:hypothetical protein JTB14_001277 [Gonioctena quinquepunctata]|nr:hypothetical protein JTB14_001277 [Gonioctena quinquepunctata]